MRKVGYIRGWIGILGLLTYSWLWASPPEHYSESSPKNLSECFDAALRQSELISNQVELIYQAEERYKQAFGALLPNLTGTANYLVQPTSTTSLFPTNQPLVKVTATQPLFQGFKEFAAIRQNKSLAEAQKYSKWHATILLYSEVSQNFYSLLSLERDQKNVLEVLNLYDQRISELSHFVNLGRSRESEILTAKTQKEIYQAQAEQIQMQLSILRETFHFLTGLSQKTLLQDDETLPVKIPSRDTYVAELSNRPDVKSAEATVRGAEANVTLAFGNHLPSVNVIGNYYFLRYGPQQNVDWDLQIGLVLPIFSGGITQSNVRIAESQKDQSSYTLSRIKRLAEQEIQSQYENLAGDLKLVDAYTRVTTLAERTYKVQVQDYKNGLVNNIDVLQALTSFQENRRNLDRSRFSVKLDYAKIEASVAHRPKYEGVL
jgi:outer membrane protein